MGGEEGRQSTTYPRTGGAAESRVASFLIHLRRFQQPDAGPSGGYRHHCMGVVLAAVNGFGRKDKLNAGGQDWDPLARVDRW